MMKMMVAKRMAEVLGCLVANFRLVDTGTAEGLDYRSVWVSGVVA